MKKPENLGPAGISGSTSCLQKEQYWKLRGMEVRYTVNGCTHGSGHKRYEFPVSYSYSPGSIDCRGGSLQSVGQVWPILWKLASLSLWSSECSPEWQPDLLKAELWPQLGDNNLWGWAIVLLDVVWVDRCVSNSKKTQNLGTKKWGEIGPSEPTYQWDSCRVCASCFCKCRLWRARGPGSWKLKLPPVQR